MYLPSTRQLLEDTEKSLESLIRTVLELLSSQRGTKPLVQEGTSVWPSNDNSISFTSASSSAGLSGSFRQTEHDRRYGSFEARLKGFVMRVTILGLLLRTSKRTQWSKRGKLAPLFRRNSIHACWRLFFLSLPPSPPPLSLSLVIKNYKFQITRKFHNYEINLNSLSLKANNRTFCVGEKKLPLGWPISPYAVSSKWIKQKLFHVEQ